MTAKGPRTVNLLETVELLHTHLTASLCRKVFRQARSRQRQRKWTFHALAQFWTAVIIRAPQSLSQALSETASGKGPLYPAVQASPEAFFEKCQSMPWPFFSQLYQAFLESVLPEAPRLYAQELGSLWERFPEIWIVDGSRCDAIARRLKILWNQHCSILPGCLSVLYDLRRGIARHVQFCPDAGANEVPRGKRLLSQLPEGTLLMGDRLYARQSFIQQLIDHKLFGLFRRNKLLTLKTLRIISRQQGSRTFLQDALVKAGSGAHGEPITLRYIRYKRGRFQRDLFTTVLDPAILSAEEALQLYPLRWTIERMFFDLKEVLNLHRFYAANPNAVAMQIYAAALVHTAFRIAQARIAQTHGVSPETLSPAKLFPKLAAASSRLADIACYKMELLRLNPGAAGSNPTCTNSVSLGRRSRLSLSRNDMEYDAEGANSPTESSLGNLSSMYPDSRINLAAMRYLFIGLVPRTRG